MVLRRSRHWLEAVALNLADNTDARMETLTEIFAAMIRAKKNGLDITDYLNLILEEQEMSDLHGIS